MTADLTYLDDGFFTAFTPNTSAGVTAWNAIAQQTDGTGKVLSVHAAATCRQLRAAGYSVSKARPCGVIDADALLRALES